MWGAQAPRWCQHCDSANGLMSVLGRLHCGQLGRGPLATCFSRVFSDLVTAGFMLVVSPLVCSFDTAGSARAFELSSTVMKVSGAEG